MIATVPVPGCLLWGPDLRVAPNEAFVALVGDQHDGVVGRPAAQVLAEAWPVLGPAVETVTATGAGALLPDQALRLRRGPATHGVNLTCSVSAVTDDRGRVLGVVLLAVETTEQVLDRRRLELLTRLNLALADVLDPTDLADLALPVLRSAPGDLAAVDLLTPHTASSGSADSSSTVQAGRVVPYEPRLAALEPNLDGALDEALAVHASPAGEVAWVRLPSSRPGTRRPVLVVLAPAATPVAGAYRHFLELVAASLAAALDRAHAHTLEQAAGDVTRALSRALQESMLTDLPQPDHLHLHTRYVPAMDTAKIGGDWYDALVLPDGATAVVIGDVVGHDVQAAAAMGQVRAMLRTLSWAFEEPPSVILTRLDQALRDLRVTCMATVLLARIEQTPADAAVGLRRLRWSDAGHPPPLLVHPDGTAELLTARNDLLVGVHPDAPRHDHTATLPPGSTLVLYTDGLVERRDQPLSTGLETLRTTAARHADLPLPAFVDALLAHDTRTGRGTGRPHDDDVAVLAVRMHPEDRPRPPEAGPSHL
ncbi:PP2C family protein-serine/threonine phosphatase [Pseudokineococcus marinus]|uniref:protein-serine/threonine phosphatase n=1 Tax=Pseudokineococcus marinus TaxID=351215 RepID=A0A849BNJ9_9ACTN|nr:PP2C family protein-serine/threonine phosphatase [Pseudokineococcus marinus]NNH22164.1 serine/threonine-protein phosphatase [Pseudokineococcus marinus]